MGLHLNFCLGPHICWEGASLASLELGGGRGGITPSTLLFHLPSPISHCQAHSYLLQILKPLWLISSDYACCHLGANKLPATKKMG